ncbi:MAG: cupin domain-containing protein [Candidatus Magasanikbacteria bacterium]|nr:cupin domain-containing protein [Candidatus Magasanikbacteria bacterium]
MLTVEEIKSLSELVPLPEEGGFYKETYRAEGCIPGTVLPARYKSTNRNYSTLIYYLLTPDVFFQMHRVASDEIFHFYLGDAVEMLQLMPDGSGKIVRIGQDIKNGEVVQCIVPHGVWQGAMLSPGGRFALMGCSVSPGFEFADYETGTRDELVRVFPQYKEMIFKLTK